MKGGMSLVDEQLVTYLRLRQRDKFRRILSTITGDNSPSNDGMRQLLRNISEGRGNERYLSFITREHLSFASFYDSYYIEFTDGKVEEKYVNVGFCVQLIQGVIDDSNPLKREIRTARGARRLSDECYLVYLMALFAELLPPNSICNRYEKEWIEYLFKDLGYSFTLSYARN